MTMFGLFKKKSQVEKLNLRYKKLLEEAYNLSAINRKIIDSKMSEANDILKKLIRVIEVEIFELIKFYSIF
jgi:hypothetical protein